MPQDPLTQLMTQRAMMQSQPQIDNPSEGSSGPLSGLKKPFEAGMDTLLSAIGLRQQRPGDVATGIGSLIGAAGMVPKLPFGAAREGLASMVQGVKEAPSEISPLLKEIFMKNPKAEGIYSAAMRSQVPEALAAREAAGQSRYTTQAKAHDALLDLSVSDRPRPIPTDTGYETAIPLESGQPKSTRALYASSRTAPVGAAQGKYNITPAMLQQIRQMDPAMASKVFPEIPSAVITKILIGSNY